MTLTELNALFDRLVFMAVEGGFSEAKANDLACRSIDNAAGVEGLEVNEECAVTTMSFYLDDMG